MIEVEPVNFLLKSEREQEIILNAYKAIFKQCDCDMQIFVQTSKVNLEDHFNVIEECIKYESDISEMANDYLTLVKDVSQNRKNMSKKFYIVLSEKNFKHASKIIQGIKSCGNEAKLCTKEDCENIYKKCYENFDSFTNYNLNNTQEEILKIYPSYFEDKNPNYLVINNKFIGSLIVTDYAKEMPAAFMNKVFEQEVDLMFSFFYEKQQTSEVLKKLTYSIGNTASEIRSISESQTDADLVNSTYSDAKYIRKKIQLEQESLYNLYSYVSLFADSKEELENNLQRIEAVLAGVGATTRRAIFRQKDAFEACMPLNKNIIDLKKYIRRNVLTEGLSSTYPFFSNELIDKNGVFLGVNEQDKSIVLIDRFNTKKYKNSNMCVIGTSGSGKSYFTKLMALRNRYLNISQYIIDPEREYLKICQKLNGSVINFESGKIVNVMDIREFSNDDGTSYLQSKLLKLNTFFSLIFKNISQEEMNLLEEKIIECYANKGITFDDNTLFYEEGTANLITTKRFKKSEDMPTLEDLNNLLKKNKKYERLRNLLKPYVSGSESYFNGYTNVDLSNKFVVADLFGMEESSLRAMMFVLTELFWDKIKVSRNKKKIIYLDEAWRLIGGNAETAKFVYKIFKTIRKYGGAVTAITQDIDDFFSLEDGKYGRGILNNSSIKTIFQLEENEINVLRKSLSLSNEEVIKIQNAKRGNCLIYAGSNHIEAKVMASKNEHQYISTDMNDRK